MPTAFNPQTGEASMLTPQGEWVPTRTAQNPQTGERSIFNGTDWEPMKAGADARYEWGDVGQAALRGVPVLGGMYERTLSPADKQRAENFDVAHPYISGGAKLAGGVAATAGLLAAAPEAGALALGLRGATPLARVANSAVSGAGIGAADAAARGEPIGPAAAIGGAAGAVAPGVGRLIDNTISGARTAFGPISKVPANVMHVGEAPVRLHAGEATGDINLQRFVDQMEKGSGSEAAKNLATEWRAGQAADLAAARAGIRTEVGGAQATPLAAMETAQDAAQQLAAQAKAAAKQEYGRFDVMQGSIAGQQAFGGIANTIENQLTNLPQPLFASPAVKNALGELERNLTTRPGISIQEASRAREMLLGRTRALGPMEGYDKMVMGKVIDAYDQHLQTAIGSKFFSGDPDALGTLQNARQLWAQYAQTFGARNPDDLGGKFVASMIKDGRSFQEMANALYGASTIGEKKAMEAATERLRDIFVQNGRIDAWHSVRQGMVSKLTEGVEGTVQKQAQAISNRLANFLNGGGAQMSKVMFTTRELALLKQYQQVMERLIPKPGAVNYSGTSYAMANLAKWTMDALAGLAGLHITGPLGVIAAPATHHALGSIAKGYQARGLARVLYNPASAPLHAPNASARTGERLTTIGARALLGT